MSSEAMVSFLRKVAPGLEQSLQQNETVDIFQAGAHGLRPGNHCSVVVRLGVSDYDDGYFILRVLSLPVLLRHCDRLGASSYH